jgi:hypothetical protein
VQFKFGYVQDQLLSGPRLLSEEAVGSNQRSEGGRREQSGCLPCHQPLDFHHHPSRMPVFDLF